MRHLTKSVVPVALVLGLGVSSVAEGGLRTSRAHTLEMDRNRDGIVTYRELRRSHRREARASALYLDLNRDGWLSPFELRRSYGRYPSLSRVGRRTRGFPVEHLHRLEMRKAELRFARLDRNRDGLLTPSELGHPRPRKNRRHGWHPRRPERW